MVFTIWVSTKEVYSLLKPSLFIIKAEVNEGPTAKRLKPRARVRSYLIKKPTCHITIVLKDISLAEYEYRDYLDLECSKNTRLINKKKNKTMTCHDTYRNGGLWDKK